MRNRVAIFRKSARLAAAAFLLLCGGARGLRAALSILDNRLPAGVLGAPYAYFALTASGGTPPYTFSLFSGALPPGVTFDNTGLFQGTPTQLGAFTPTFQVRDAATATVTKALSLTVSPPAVPPQWSPRGLAGGTIRAMTISPDYAADSTIFALGGSNEINRSSDLGATWSHVIVNPANPGQWVEGFALSPVFSMNGFATEEARTIFAATGGGMYKSTDHGNSYAYVGTTLPDGATRLAISPAYAADRTVFVAGYQRSADTRLFRSTDRGLTYSLLATLPGLTAGIRQIAVSPNYAADRTLFLIGENRSEIQRSLDGGLTWTIVYTLPPAAQGALQIAISPDYATDRTLFVAGTYHIYRSSDGGTSFALQRFWTVGMVSLAMVKRPAQTPLLYYLTYDWPAYMIFLSDDYGATATQLYGDGVRLPAYGLAVSPQLAGGLSDLYAHGSLGVDLSRDGGFSFSPRDQGLNAYVFNSLSGSGAVIAAGGENGWFKSGNSGNGWVRRNFPFATDTFALYPTLSPNYAADSTLFMTNTQEVYRSTDGGASFTMVLQLAPQTYYYPGFAVAPDFNPATGTVFAGSWGSGLWRSVNGGQSFSLITGGGTCPLTAASGVSGAAISPRYATDRTLFITVGPVAGPAQLCRSSDGGTTWTLLRAAVTYNVSLSPMYDQAGANGTLAKMVTVSDGANFFEILRSLDGGVTFTGTGSFANAPTHFSPAFALDGTILVDDYYGTNGILRSGDFGVTFAPLGAANPLGTRIVTGLHFAPGFDGRNTTNSVALAGTQGSGVWKSTDGGRTFNPLYGYETLSSALNGIARGPGDAQNTPIFAATADQGIYRSSDGGDTFAAFSAGLPADANAKAVVVPSSSATNPVTSVAGAGLYRYNGTAWSQVPTAPAGTFTSLLEFPRPLGGNYLYATRADGVSLRSADNGWTWTTQDAAQGDLIHADYNAQTTPTFTQPASRVKGPSFPAGNTASLWAVSASDGPRWSADSGASWTATPGTNDYALPSGQSWSVVRALGINPVTNAREVIAGSATGLYLSKDGGVTWKAISGAGSGLETTSRNFSATLSTVTSYGTTDILVGANGAANGGVYLSGDGGQHWTQVNQGFDPGNLSISSLVKTSCSGCPVQYYSGTFGSGVYTRTISVVAPPQFPGVNFACAGAACTCGTGPFSGPVSGGTAVTLCGSGFQNGVVVEFDGLGASGCTQSGGTTITCTATPPHAAGYALVRVRNPDTRAGTLPANYQYIGGTSRADTLRVVKSGANAWVSWNCAGCTAGNPALLYRAQNAVFSLYLESYSGGASGTTTGGCTAAAGTTSCHNQTGAAGSAQSYFWSVE